jgi:hypothetical protein
MARWGAQGANAIAAVSGAWIMLLATGLLVTGALASGVQAQPPLPRFDGQVHVGVATCAGPCHGRQSALGVAEGPAMRGSEIVVWQDLNTLRGKHSQAFKALEGARGRDIGRKLGIGDPATAQECLSCHSDDPAAGKRGPQLLRSDGVSCEACHGGGGGKWLAAHYAPGATHAQNIANGMYPTDQPVARARLCESCHLGASAADQYVTHRIMGAGHPRLTFELELFTALQAHHYEDQDYAARKPITNRAKVWAIGQVAAFRSDLQLFIDSPHARAGIFPEETFFDCRSCHRLISDSDAFRSHWKVNPGRPLGPGVPVFNDANLIVLVAAAHAVSPGLASTLDARGRAFHAALQEDPASVRRAGAALIGALDEVLAAFERTEFDPSLARAMLRGVVSTSLSDRYTTSASAEQAIMAIDSLSRTLADAGRPLPPAPPKPGDTPVLAQQAPMAVQTPPSPPSPAKAEIDAAYKTVADPNTYDQEAFRHAIGQVASRLGLS